VAASVADDALALQRLYHWDRTAPDRLILAQPTGDGAVRDYSWHDVVDQSRRVATHLHSLGLRPGDRVGILAKNSAHWLMSDFAIWIAGGVSVPLYPTQSPEAIRQILEHSECRLLFVGKLDAWNRIKSGVPAGLSCVSHPLSPLEAKQSYSHWDDIVSATAPLVGEPTRPGESLATIIYTSGTTGAPKGVMHCFASLAWAAQSSLSRFPEIAGGRRLSHLPLCHVMERALIECGMLASGFRVYFGDSPETFSDDMRRARPTRFSTVPRLWTKFQQSVCARVPAETLERVLQPSDHPVAAAHEILKTLGLDECSLGSTGAAPMPPDLLRWYAKLGLQIIEGYGMTENIVTHTTMPDGESFGTVGLPYPQVECRLESSTLEIQIKTPAVMLGYYKEPELTTQAFTPDGWLRTGDKGEFGPAGHLRITGRVKDLFKTSKGKYVAPAPIENKLARHAAVEACCVTGAGLSQPIALLMLNEFACRRIGDSADRLELEASLAEHMDAINTTLEPHERLDCFVVMKDPWTVDNGMVTPTSKIKRHYIEETFAEQYDTWVGVGKPVVWHDS
jgi:long-chain acyl-CoA synthetase